MTAETTATSRNPEALACQGNVPPRNTLGTLDGCVLENVESIARRFWAKVAKGPSCWTWTGATDGAGYGQLRIRIGGRSRAVKAHRLSLSLSGRDVPPGLFTLHSCDNPPCIRPDHLRTGTQVDNVRDCIERGRNFVPPPLLGEAHPHAVLDEEGARAIFLARGRQRDIAAEYGVSQRTVWQIKNRIVWRDVTADLGDAPPPPRRRLRSICRNGLHALTPGNLYESGRRRQCRACARSHYQPHPRVLVSSCVHGHAYDEANTRWYQGRRYCRACERTRGRSRASCAQVVIGVLIALLALTSCKTAYAAPGIVLIIADDLSVRDLALAMPRVTELAAQGVQFDAAFSPLPLCGPSRISLLTGKLPRTHGFRSNDPTGFDASDTIATRLHASGFATTIVGKLLNNHELATNIEAGWDTYLPFRDHRDFGTEQSEVLASQAMACMDGPSPHFCYVGVVAPHGPLPGPARCQERPIPERPPAVAEERWTQRMTALCGLDDMAASIVEHRGSNTYVIFTSDNGWIYAENGRNGKSELVLDAAQVPLIVWGPDVVPAHRREMVSLVDISATVLRLANVGRDGIEGQSLLPLLRDQDAARWVGRLEIEGQ